MEDSDKFILVSLDDDSSKFLSEVLGNKTCKKIIDFLSERKEASEKDIADGLKIPLNTVEYNLGKLIKSGLVKKTSNFFWSVKGKKIPMYKLANKHIVISPRKKPSPESLKVLIPAFIGIFLGLFIMGMYNYYFNDGDLDISQGSLNMFDSVSAVNNKNFASSGFMEATPSLDFESSSRELEKNYQVYYVGEFVYAISDDKIILFTNSSGNLEVLDELDLSMVCP